MHKHLRAIALVALAATVIATAGCSKKTDATGTDKGAAAATPDKVTYVTAFGAVGRDALAWVAEEKGFFKEANFDVTIQLGAATDQNLSALTAGQAQFASIDLTGTMIQAGKGAYKDVRAFAVLHQQTLVSIVSLEGNKVTQPKDLEGKKLGAATGSVNQLLFPAYAKLAGIDPTKVTWANVAPAQLPTLLASGQVDALSTFLISRGGIEKAAAGKKAVVLPYSDYLSDLYGNAFITTSAIASQKPEMVKRFRDALLKAVAYTIEHPEEAAAILHKAQPAADVAAATGEIKLMTPYVKATNGAPIGSFDQQRVARAIAILQGAGLIPAGLTPEAIVAFDLAPKAA